MSLLLLSLAFLSLSSAQSAALVFSNLTCGSSGPGCQDDGCGTDTLCVLVNQCFNYGGGLYNSNNQLVGSISYQSDPNNPNGFVLHYFNQTDCVGEMGVTNFVKGQDCEDPRPEVSMLQTVLSSKTIPEPRVFAIRR